MVVTWVMGLAAAGLIAALVRRWVGTPAALFTVALWAVQPAAFVLDHPYSEATFTCFSAACLYCIDRRWWWSAGTFAALAGATRPTGLVLVPVCAVAAAAALWRHREWTALLAPLLSPLGTVGFEVYLWWLTGRWDSSLVAARVGWHTGFDWGHGNLSWLLNHRHDLSPYTEWQLWLVPLMSAVVLLGVAGALRLRLPAPALVYVLGLLVLVWSIDGQYSSIPRYLLPAFPALVPYAAVFSRLPAVGGAVWMLSLGLMVGYGLVYFVIQAPGFAP
jgi:hypothetical protein